MDLNNFIQKLNDLPISVAIREGATAFPWIETVHVLAIVTVVGTISIIDLRLLGIRSHTRSVRAVIRELLPYTWGAFAIAVIAGTLLFLSNAVTYAGNTMFRIKMVLILLAGLNMLFFHLVTHRKIHIWDELESTPALAKLAGGSSLLLWTAVIFFGRWIGFTLY